MHCCCLFVLKHFLLVLQLENAESQAPALGPDGEVSRCSLLGYRSPYLYVVKGRSCSKILFLEKHQTPYLYIYYITSANKADDL